MGTLIRTHNNVRQYTEGSGYSDEAMCNVRPPNDIRKANKIKAIKYIFNSNHLSGIMFNFSCL